MPIDYKKNYVGWWHQFSRYIRHERAKNKCEQCGVLNGGIKFITTNKLNGTVIEPEKVAAFENNNWLMVLDAKKTKIVLTVAHLDYEGGICQCKAIHGIKCAIPSHCLALCQACHLRLDMPHHVKNRAENLMKKRDSERLLLAEMNT